jgi:phage/plasmid-like protein (TIGR03299 family)
MTDWTQHSAFNIMGKAVSHPEGLTGKEALAAAGLTGWNVRALPFGVMDPLTGEPASSVEPGLRTIVRTDPETGNPQIIGGCVTKQYVPIDPEELFSGIADGLIHESLVAETGGAYGPTPGAMAFMSFLLPSTLEVEGDGFRNRILLTTDNTGRGSATATLHRERIFCTNMIRRIKGSSVTWKLQHSSRAEDLDARIKEAREILGLVEMADDIFTQQVKELIERETTNAEFDKVVEHILGKRPADEGRAQTRFDTRLDEIHAAYADPSHATFKNTAWGILNTFTLWDQHLRTAKGGDEGRAIRAVFGTDVLERKVLEGLAAL